MEELRRCPANIHVFGRDRGPGVGREVGRMNSLGTEQVGGPCGPPPPPLPSPPSPPTGPPAPRSRDSALSRHAAELVRLSVSQPRQLAVSLLLARTACTDSERNVAGAFIGL